MAPRTLAAAGGSAPGRGSFKGVFCLARKKISGPERAARGFSLLCAAPAFALTVAFMILPTVKVFYLSFFSSTGLSKNERFVGLENYAYLLEDEALHQALGNTAVLLAVGTALCLGLALLMAFICAQSGLREKKLYKVILFTPSILSVTVVGILWSFIYHPRIGILNGLLDALGLSALKHTWLGEPGTVLYALAAVFIWLNAGYYMVMYIAGINGISPSVFEAATIDGATKPQQLWYITLPLMKNLIGITTVLCISNLLASSFTLVTIMTNGQPSGASSVILFYMYQTAFRNSNFGYAMAIAVLTLALAFLLSLFSNRLSGASGEV